MKLVNKVVNKVDPVCPIIEISSSFPSMDCLLANEAAAMYDCSRKAKGVESTEHLVQPGTTEKFEDQSGEKKTQQGSPECMHLGRDSRWMSFWIWTYFSILREALPWYSASCLDTSNSSFNFFQKMIFVHIHIYIYIYMYSLSKCSQQISFFSSANSTLVKEPGGSVKDLAVSAPVAPKAIPQRLGDTEPSWKIFHRKDDRFLQPKVPLKRVTKWCWSLRLFFGQLFLEWFLVGIENDHKVLFFTLFCQKGACKSCKKMGCVYLWVDLKRPHMALFGLDKLIASTKKATGFLHFFWG